MSAFKARDQYNGTASEKTWLVSILKNKIIDYFKKASTRNESPLKLRGNVDAPSYDHFFDSARKGHWADTVEPKEWTDASLKTESKEFYLVLQKCLMTLPAKWAGIFSMSLIDDKDSREVCKEFQITSSNFWVIMHRSKLQIRECLEKNWLKIQLEEIKSHTYKWYEFGCKDATYLTTKEHYASLSISEKGLLKFHLLTCNSCRKFVKQIKLIEELLKKEPDFKGLTLSIEKKDAINQLLTNK